MAQIFISYAREDHNEAHRLAHVFRERGWSVWWDRQILPGQAFDQVIGRELDVARCVVVLWSKHSVASDWVKEEASEAARRGVLVPVHLDDAKIPLGSRRIEAARLSRESSGRWAGNALETRRLIDAVGHHLGAGEMRPTGAQPPFPPTTSRPPAPVRTRSTNPTLGPIERALFLILRVAICGVPLSMGPALLYEAFSTRAPEALHVGAGVGLSALGLYARRVST